MWRSLLISTNHGLTLEEWSSVLTPLLTYTILVVSKFLIIPPDRAELGFDQSKFIFLLTNKLNVICIRPRGIFHSYKKLLYQAGQLFGHTINDHLSDGRGYFVGN